MGFAEGQAIILEELKIKSPERLMLYIRIDDVETISEIMTQYYKDPAKTYIPWRFMTFVARMKLEGIPTAGIEERLEILRKYITDFREQRRKSKQKE